MKTKLLIILVIFFAGIFYSCDEEFDSIEPEEVLNPIVEVVGTYDMEYWNVQYYISTGDSYQDKMDDVVMEIIPDGEGEYALYLGGYWHATLVLEHNYDGILYFDIVEHGGMWTSGLSWGWLHYERKGGSWSEADYPMYPGSFQINKNNKFEICFWYYDIYYWETGDPYGLEIITFYSGYRRTSETTVD